MRGYVVKRQDRVYAVIYEGIDPISGASDADGLRQEPTVRRQTNSPVSLPRTIAAIRGALWGRHWSSICGPPQLKTMQTRPMCTISRNLTSSIFRTVRCEGRR